MYITSVVIVDSEFNDCLNPESPSYFGEEYIEGIKFLDGTKQTIPLPYSYCPNCPAPNSWILTENNAPLNAEDIADLKFIQPPLRWNERYGYMDTENSRGYYFIRLPYRFSGHFFIRYPN